MKLIDEIIALLSDQKGSLTDALLKTKVNRCVGWTVTARLPTQMNSKISELLPYRWQAVG